MPRADGPAAAYAAFAAFGALWGAWGAALPAVRDQAQVSAAGLGTALLFVGAGALPAMALVGPVVDRRPRAAPAVLLVLMACAGVLVATTACDATSLAVTLAVLGVASGAADVAINSLAASSQHALGRPVVNRSHAVFSSGVVVASLVTGAVLTVGVPVVVPFLLVLLATLASAGLVLRHHVPPRLSAGATRGSVGGTGEHEGLGAGEGLGVGDGLVAGDGLGGGDGLGAGDGLKAGEQGARLSSGVLVVLAAGGVLGAVAFAVENAHQSWSALFLVDELGAGALVAATGPAVFAAVVAVTRWTTSPLAVRAPGTLLVVGAGLAAVGSAGLAVSPVLPVALLSLAVTASGTAVLFPTLVSALVAPLHPSAKGRATSLVAGTAYVGFLLGPVVVGQVAARADLRAAMLVVAGMALVLLVASAAAVRWTGRRQPVRV